MNTDWEESCLQELYYNFTTSKKIVMFLLNRTPLLHMYHTYANLLKFSGIGETCVTFYTL